MTRLPRRAAIALAPAFLLAASLGSALAAKHPASPPPHTDPMDGIDTDNDGTISLDEANVAAAAKFDSLDTTLDGKLDRAEMKGVLTPAAFREADANGDKLLSKEDFMAYVAKRYKAADTDHDDKIDAAELKTPAGKALLVLLK